MARIELEVEKRTSYLGKTWEAGEVLEVDAEETEEYPLKGMLKTGIVEKIEEETEEKDASPDADKVTADIGVERLTKPELTQINGIGPSYAEKLIERYGTYEELLNESPEDIADDVHGISPTVAERLLERAQRKVS